MGNEQRIWNKSELEQMPEWNEDDDFDWIKVNPCINKKMIGKSVQWCKDQGYRVTPEMIAKTEQPKTAIAANGTELVVGGRYRLKGWEKDCFIEILAVGKTLMICNFIEDGDINEFSYQINENWLPYTDLKEELKPLEGYQKWYIHLDRNVVKVEYMTTKQAKDLKSKSHILGVYTEKQAIELGLVI